MAGPQPPSRTIGGGQSTLLDSFPDGVAGQRVCLVHVSHLDPLVIKKGLVSVDEVEVAPHPPGSLLWVEREVTSSTISLESFKNAAGPEIKQVNSL
jgi:hypothetical protein